VRAMPKTQPKRVKHIPMRTCIACRENKPKRELLRVVRTPDGHVQLDATGKKAGRGAYLCAKLSCWEIALKRKRLESEFEVTISAEDREALDAFVSTLPTDDPTPAPEASGKVATARRKTSNAEASSGL
jgi:predicted RNA-binding protein YlxR (DUF448 family)